jgi:hypothetical protein
MNPGDLRYSPLLSNLAVRYQNRGYIAEQIFRTVPVELDVGTYSVYDDDVVFRLFETTMSHLASANEIDISLTRAQFTLEEHALKVWVDPLEVRQAGPEPVRAAKVDALMNSHKLKLEDRVATIMADATVFTYGETLAGAAQFSDPTSDPRVKIQNVMGAMLASPNVAVMSLYTKNVLLNHPRLIEAIKYTQGGIATEDTLARYLGVERILVGEAYKNTAKKGQAQNLQPVWGKHIWLLYTPPGQPTGLMNAPAAGYLPVWNKGGRGLWRTYTWRDGNRGTEEGAEGIKVEATYKPLVSAPRLAYRLTNAVA